MYFQTVYSRIFKSQCKLKNSWCFISPLPNIVILEPSEEGVQNAGLFELAECDDWKVAWSWCVVAKWWNTSYLSDWFLCIPKFV